MLLDLLLQLLTHSSLFVNGKRHVFRLFPRTNFVQVLLWIFGNALKDLNLLFKTHYLLIFCLKLVAKLDDHAKLWCLLFFSCWICRLSWEIEAIVYLILKEIAWFLHFLLICLLIYWSAFWCFNSSILVRQVVSITAIAISVTFLVWRDYLGNGIGKGNHRDN